MCALNEAWDSDKASLSPEERCPLSGGNRYKDYVNSFPGPNVVPLNGCVPL